MRNLIAALGPNATTYEAIALKIVDLIDSTGVSLEVGAIALKTAQLILDAKQRDAWDSMWTDLVPTFKELEASQEMLRASQV